MSHRPPLGDFPRGPRRAPPQWLLADAPTQGRYHPHDFHIDEPSFIATDDLHLLVDWTLPHNHGAE